MNVADWLRALGFERYEATFRENAVGTELLPDLTADDPKDLGVTLIGHRRPLLKAIAALRPEVQTDDPVRLSVRPTENVRTSESIAECRASTFLAVTVIARASLSTLPDNSVVWSHRADLPCLRDCRHLSPATAI
jgi:hypothetical protein